MQIESFSGQRRRWCLCSALIADNALTICSRKTRLLNLFGMLILFKKWTKVRAGVTHKVFGTTVHNCLLKQRFKVKKILKSWFCNVTLYKNIKNIFHFILFFSSIAITTFSHNKSTVIVRGGIVSTFSHCRYPLGWKPITFFKVVIIPKLVKHYFERE